MRSNRLAARLGLENLFNRQERSVLPGLHDCFLKYMACSKQHMGYWFCKNTSETSKSSVKVSSPLKIGSLMDNSATDKLDASRGRGRCEMVRRDTQRQRGTSIGKEHWS
jgi:hypothetical protein